MTTIIAPRVHDIGGLEVRRAVPTLQARSIGSFVFVDQMGPALMHPGTAIDVRPHPHIGLATVTYLWSGAIGHRDTLGSDQVIRPGDVNWMTAGRGIAHSERTPQPDRDHDNPIHGMQTWVALPKSHEEIEPAFYHHAAATLPEQRRNGAWLRVIAGRAYGEESPVKVFADTSTWQSISTRMRKSISTTATASARCTSSKATRSWMAWTSRAAPGDPRSRRTRPPAREDAGEGDAVRWRAAGWPAPPVVELRVQLEGAHRAGQARLGGRPLRHHSGRRQGIHPAAAVLNIACCTHPKVYPCTRR
jgi:hypothetical protein